MSISKAADYALAASCALALLTGCAGGNAAITPAPFAQVPVAGAESIQTRPLGIAPMSSARKDAKIASLVFGSLPDGNAVDIFSQGGTNPMVGQITGLSHPFGLAVDLAGNLYIANQTSPTVPVYAPPYTKGPKMTLMTNGNLPQEVAISRRGIVAVADCCSSVYEVDFYSKNSTTPCNTVSVPAPSVVEGVAFDADDNLFMVGQSGANGFIGEIKGACKAKKTRLLTAAGISGPLYDVKIDQADHIAILPGGSSIIYTYDQPKLGSLGNPVSMTQLTTSGGGFNFAFLASGRELYANLNLTGAYKYDYPAGGGVEDSILFSFHGDVAVSPALIP